MTDEKKPKKIEYAPGCFDNFEGTQAELDELMKQIEDMFESGEAFVKAIPIEEMIDKLSDEELEELAERLGIDPDEYMVDEDVTDVEPPTTNRTLH